MTIPAFATSYFKNIKVPTLRTAILREADNLLFLEGIQREKQIGITKVTIINPAVVKNYLTHIKLEHPLKLKEVLSLLEIKENFLKCVQEYKTQNFIDDKGNITDIRHFVSFLAEQDNIS